MRGKLGWRPAYLEDEIKDIMREERIAKESNAIQKLVDHARTGREIERLAKFDLINAWKNKKNLPDLKQYRRR